MPIVSLSKFKTRSLIHFEKAQMSSIYQLSPPHGVITNDSHGGYVVITTWIMLCFFTTCVLARLATRTGLVTIGMDDAMAAVAMVIRAISN